MPQQLCRYRTKRFTKTTKTRRERKKSTTREVNEIMNNSKQWTMNCRPQGNANRKTERFLLLLLLLPWFLLVHVDLHFVFLFDFVRAFLLDFYFLLLLLLALWAPSYIHTIYLIFCSRVFTLSLCLAFSVTDIDACLVWIWFFVVHTWSNWFSVHILIVSLCSFLI